MLIRKAGVVVLALAAVLIAPGRAGSSGVVRTVTVEAAVQSSPWVLLVEKEDPAFETVKVTKPIKSTIQLLRARVIQVLKSRGGPAEVQGAPWVVTDRPASARRVVQPKDLRPGMKITIADCDALRQAIQYEEHARKGIHKIYLYRVLEGADQLRPRMNQEKRFVLVAGDYEPSLAVYCGEVGLGLVEVAKLPLVKRSLAVSQLLDAVRSGHRSELEAVLRSGAEVNATAEDGSTALHLAAIGGSLELVQLLVAKGAKVNAPSDGGTPLYRAADFGHRAIFDFLRKKGARLELGDRAGRSALALAVRNGRRPVVELLIASGASLDTAARDGTTPLQEAVSVGRLELARLLISKGAKLKLRNRAGKSALDLCAANAGSWGDQDEYWGVVLQLLGKDEPLAGGKSALAELLRRAADSGKEQPIRELVRRGAEVTARNSDGKSSLDLALEKERWPALRRLIETGVGPRTDRKVLEELRQSLVSKGQAELAQLLLTKGAAPGKAKKGK